MADTFHTFEDYADGSAAFGTPMPENQLVAEHPYFVRTAMWSLHNAAGSGKIVRVRCVEVSESAPTGNSEGGFKVERISAVVGGEALSAMPFDSTNDAIPSQVTIVKNASEVTATSVVRRVSRAVSTSIAGGDMTELVRVNKPFDTMGSSDMQDVVLREGEGVSLSPEHDLIFGRTMPYEMSVLFTIGTDTYLVQTLTGTRVEPALVIFNGTGSGVVITVRRIQTRVHGTWTGFSSEYSVERIHSHRDGTEAAPLAMDSTSTLSPMVTAKRGAVCMVDGAFRGAYITRSAIRRYGPQHMGTAQGGAARLIKYTKLLYGQDADSDLVLREGEGMGIFMRTLTSLFYPQVTVTWTVEDEVSAVTPIARGFA